jgi:RNA polymerase-interacting CarD/CdnL/TRCF family regulator
MERRVHVATGEWIAQQERWLQQVQGGIQDALNRIAAGQPMNAAQDLRELHRAAAQRGEDLRRLNTVQQGLQERTEVIDNLREEHQADTRSLYEE